MPEFSIEIVVLPLQRQTKKLKNALFSNVEKSCYLFIPGSARGSQFLSQNWAITFRVILQTNKQSNVSENTTVIS